MKHHGLVLLVRVQSKVPRGQIAVLRLGSAEQHATDLVTLSVEEDDGGTAPPLLLLARHQRLSVDGCHGGALGVRQDHGEFPGRLHDLEALNAEHRRHRTALTGPAEFGPDPSDSDKDQPGPEKCDLPPKLLKTVHRFSPSVVMHGHSGRAAARVASTDQGQADERA